MCTTQEQFYAALRDRVGPPSWILIEMANDDQAKKTGHFVNRNLLHYSEATKMPNLEALKILSADGRVRQRESIVDLTAFVLQ